MRIEFGPLGYLLKALWALGMMRAALIQAWRWNFGRLRFAEAARACHRDALCWGRIARGFLSMWRWLLAGISRPLSDAELMDGMPVAAAEAEVPVVASWREFPILTLEVLP